MFNKWRMADNQACELRSAKFSRAKSFGFRPGPELRDKVITLVNELSVPGREMKISDVLRDGFTAYWPQIRTYMLARAHVGDIKPETLDLIMAASTRAHQLGLDPEEIDRALAEALSAKLQGGRAAANL